MEPIDYTIRAPYDGDFIKSFHITDDPNEIKDFLKAYGFVVFDDVLTEEQIERSIDDLWKARPEAKRDDPNTWTEIHHKYGFAGGSPLDGLQIWDNRQNENIYKAFKLCYELWSDKLVDEPLVSCFDRGNIMLPTQGEFGKEEWKSLRNPHWDLNPYVWTEQYTPQGSENRKFYSSYSSLLSEGNATPSYGYAKLRAVLQLSESRENTGGFECLAGFNRYIQTWCRENPLLPRQYVSAYGWNVPSESPVAKNMQKILVRKGSLIIFSGELPHTMFPNESSGFRYAQYLRMAPLSTLEITEEIAEKRKNLVNQHLPPDLVITPLGREVFLLE